MGLKDELYALNKGRTFAENIDMAWAIYGDLDKHTDEDRQVAQLFLIYAFDLKSADNINGQLLALMHQRNLYKIKNPEFIPGLSPKHLKLHPEEMIPNRTKQFKKASNPKINGLFHALELLDVNKTDKLEDLSAHNPTRYFNSRERAQRRVHIHKGKFHQRGKLFDTQSYEAHEKSGYAAFTLNANGELSVFKHLGMRDNIAHSSMNSGSPVVCAGELVITNGELVAINTYSGHYEPQLFNVFRALEHFDDKGVNVSETKIYTFSNPAAYGLSVVSSRTNIRKTNGTLDSFYETSANVFIPSMREKLNQSLQSIRNDTEQYQATSFKNIIYAIKDSLTGATLTSDRKQIAAKIENTVTKLMTELSNDDTDNTEKLKKLIEELETLKRENTTLSRSNGKSTGNGRLNMKIESFLQQAHATYELIPKISKQFVGASKRIY